MQEKLDVHYQEKRYFLNHLSHNSSGFFKLEDYGLISLAKNTNTGNYKGYSPKYAVRDNRFLLTDLFIHLPDGNLSNYALNGCIPEKVNSNYWLPHHYKNVDMLVKFTGGMIVDTPANPLPVLFDFKSPVLEFVIEKGIIKDVFDHTEAMKKLSSISDLRKRFRILQDDILECDYFNNRSGCSMAS